MARHRSGRGLMFAGLIVIAVGVAAALREAFHLPGYWTTIAVGVALLSAGLLCARGSGRGPDSAPPGAA